MTQRVLTITAHNRPHYFQPVLDSWYRAQSGHYWPTILNVEPVSDRVIEMAHQASFIHHKTHVNDELLGPLKNPYWALERAFDVPGTTFVVLGEDDSVVSPDILDYFTRMCNLYEYDQSVLAVCSFTQQSRGHPNQVFKQRYFASVVWGIWRDRWEDWLRDAWPFDYNPAWDQTILDRLHFTNKFCVFPAISRSQHIGEHGSHMGAEYFREWQADKFYEGARVTEYKEADLG